VLARIPVRWALFVADFGRDLLADFGRDHLADFNPRSDSSIDTHREPRIHGEVPTFYPTIIQQIEEFDELNIDHDSINLIVLDSGVNDIRVTTILDPLCPPRKIEKLVEIYCHQHMVMLLECLSAKFKNAKIIIIGYYQILTEESEAGYIHVLLKALRKVPANGIADIIIGIFERPLKRRILVNCETFATRAKAAFEQSAEQLNRQLAANRVFVVPAPIETEHAALSADPWLFGINDDLSPQDTMAKIRAEECRCAEKRVEVVICDKASAGHPNHKGSKAYAEAMFKLILEAKMLGNGNTAHPDKAHA
jgi:hypothetical protein